MKLSANAKSFFDRFAATQAVSGCGIRNVKLSAPVFKAESLVFNGEGNVIPPVFYLIGSRCPLAVFFMVSSIVIYPLNSVPSWSFAHIFKEGLKGFGPRFTYIYASTAVVVVRWVIWILASLFNALPNSIFRRSRKPMLGMSFFRAASARGHAPLLKMVSPNCGIITALTNTIPVRSFVLGGPANDSEPAVLFSGSVYKVISRHNSDPLLVA